MPSQNSPSQRPTNHSNDYHPQKITEPKLKFDLKKFLKWSSICLFLGFIAHCQLTYDGVANEDWSWVGDLLENDEVDVQNYLGKKMVREDSNLIAQKLIVDLSVYDFVDVVKNDTKLFESSITWKFLFYGFLQIQEINHFFHFFVRSSTTKFW